MYSDSDSTAPIVSSAATQVVTPFSKEEEEGHFVLAEGVSSQLSVSAGLDRLEEEEGVGLVWKWVRCWIVS